jgi:glycyl-tRNA synthetase (class II)
MFLGIKSLGGKNRDKIRVRFSQQNEMKFQSSECQDLCKKQLGFGESKSLIIRTAFQIQIHFENMSPSLLENKCIIGRMIWRILEHIISPIV